jgi:hypothetical protein
MFITVVDLLLIVYVILQTAKRKYTKMEIYPTSISENERVPRSERIIFDCFARSERRQGYVAFHSINLPDHPTKFVGETDFVVLTPAGILVIEVKGSVVVLENRVWIQKETKKKPKRIENPFTQAKGNMYALNEVIEEANLPFKYKHNLLGYGVVFPECKFEQDGADVERAALFDSRILRKADPIRFVITELEKYWGAKIRKGAVKFPRENWRKMERWFKPKYQSVPSLRAEREGLYRKRVALTKSQMDFLETAAGKKRIICQGGAGTGKTLLGLEYARVKELQKFEVAMMVPDNLIEYLRGKGYQERWILSYERLPKMSDDSVDWLVVDESQDLMNLDDFSEIDRILKGGVESGNWLLLIDHQNQRGVRGKFDPLWMKTISDFSEADLVLPRNVRNTKKIIESTKQLTGRDIGKEGTGEGPKTDWIRYETDEERNRIIKEKVDQLVVSELDPGEIVIVGVDDGPHEESLAKGLQGLGIPIEAFAEGDLAKYPFKKLGYATPAQIKGIEAYCIILDIGEFGTAKLSEPSFYVAITRAKGKLLVAYPRTSAQELSAIVTLTDPSNHD